MSNLSLSGNLRIIWTNSFQNTVGISTATDSLSDTTQSVWTNGTGANKAQIIAHGTFGVSTSSSHDIDLSEGLATPYGTAALTSVKYLYLENTSTAVGAQCRIGNTLNSFSSPFGTAGDKISLDPGGLFLTASPVNGYPVTGGTNDILTVSNVGSTLANITFLVIGEGSLV